MLSKGTPIGPFILQEAIKSGGMGEVYRAKHKDTRADVALKISRLDSPNVPQNANSLRQEVDLLIRLKHPGVVRVLPIPLTGHKDALFFAKAANIPGQPWYYAMEYLGGGSLSLLTRQTKRLPYQFVAALGARVCKILDYVHSQGVVHLDIKPDNIIFRQPLMKNKPFDPVMIDFGVAAKSLQKGAAGGTLVFMPPEYIQRNRGTLPPEANIDLKKVDIYALGVVIYRLWTGQYPFGGISDKTLTSNIMTQNVRLPRSLNAELPTQVDKLMLEWLCKDPFQRPTLLEIERELQYLSQGLTLCPDNLNGSSGKHPFWQFWKN